MLLLFTTFLTEKKVVNCNFLQIKLCLQSAKIHFCFAFAHKQKKINKNKTCEVIVLAVAAKNTSKYQIP